jgi:hypothetical protein
LLNKRARSRGGSDCSWSSKAVVRGTMLSAARLGARRC